jgi:hypothetical protein
LREPRAPGAGPPAIRLETPRRPRRPAREGRAESLYILGQTERCAGVGSYKQKPIFEILRTSGRGRAYSGRQSSGSKSSPQCTQRSVSLQGPVGTPRPDPHSSSTHRRASMRSQKSSSAATSSHSQRTQAHLTNRIRARTQLVSDSVGRKRAMWGAQESAPKAVPLEQVLCACGRSVG